MFLFITHTTSYDWLASLTFFIQLSLFKDQWNIGLMKYKSADNINIDLLNETEPSQEAAHITQNTAWTMYTNA